MENMEYRFKGYDSMRQREAADAYRLSEFKNKLMYGAERELRAFLAGEGLDGVKITSTRVDDLELKENPETGLPIFTGKVIAEASFYDKGVEKFAELPVTIQDSQPAVRRDDVKTALKKAEGVATTVETPRMNTVSADLSSFQIVDDGTQYLKIYHTAAYGDLEPIGAVAKQEYEEVGDHEHLLREMLQDEAASWPSDISFEGEFVEPQIVSAAITEDPQYVVKAFTNQPECGNPNCHCGEACDPSKECPTCNPAESMMKQADDGKYIYTATDATRLALEAEHKNFDDLKTRLQQRALMTFQDVWNSKHLGNMNIANSSIDYNEASGKGEVMIEAEVLDGKDNKLVPFTVGFSGTSMTMPDLSDVTSLLKDAPVIKVAGQGRCKDCSGTGLNKEASCEGCAGTGDVNNKVRKPALKKEANLKKEATPMAPPNVGYQEVLRMPKDFLPKSLKVGDVIEVDGLKYKLSSKSEGQLSKERDTGSHWTFLRCNNDEDSSYRQDSY